MLNLVWSPVAGQAGTTTAFCALSYFLSKRCELGEKVLMLRTKLGKSSVSELMASSLFGLNRGSYNTDPMLVFDEITGDKNMDRLLMSYVAGLQLKGVINENAIKLNSSLYVIEAGKSRHRELYESELNNALPAIIKASQSDYKHVCIEAASGFSSLNHTLFELADIIFVCLPQNTFAFQNINRRVMSNEKMYAVFGLYDYDSVLNSKNLSRILPFGKRYTELPYLTSLKNAYSAGELMKEFEELSCSAGGFEFEKTIMGLYTP